MTQASARAEFEALKATLLQSSAWISRRMLGMTPDEAAQLDDDSLRAKSIEPSTFRAAVAARERMEREEGTADGKAGDAPGPLHPAWAASNAKLQAQRGN